MRLKPKLKQKRWEAINEREIIKFWTENEIFKFIHNPMKPVYIIDTPPPYVSGRAHIGFAIHYAQIDMIARYHRMLGSNVIFPACTDRNGLPVEVKVEKKLGKSMHDIDREDFLQICKRELDKAEENAIQVMKWMGLSCNAFYGSPEMYYQTDSPEYRFNTQRTFCRAWHEGKILRATRPNNWCIDCGTTIADAEIEYRDDDSTLYYIKFNIENSDETITIATTRPEMIPTCELIIFHPSDARYFHLKGKNAITPLFNKTVPIKVHREANPKFGSGIMMICAYGDKSDVSILREFGVTFPKTMIKPDGYTNEVSGKYQEHTIEEAQNAILKDLDEKGFLIGSGPTSRRVPICWRSKTPIEIIAMDEYYLQQIKVLPELEKIVNRMKFYPKSSRIILKNWLSSINMDWAISRRRFYGTSIPIWYCPKCYTPNVPKENQLKRYYEAWKEMSPISTCYQCGNSLKEAIGEERTFDTWFDSSISELIACNYGNTFFEDKNGSFFSNNFPCSIRPQGKEIVRTWLYYTILRAYHLFKKPAFKQVWISGLVRDPYGGKMSKSLGNSIDPLLFLQPPILPEDTPKMLRPDQNSWKIIAEMKKSSKFLGKSKPSLFYGADSLRLTSCLQGSHGSDIRFSLSKLEGNAKFITKLWNISRFISTFPIEKSPKSLSPTDQWILNSLDALIYRCGEGYEKLDFSIPTENIYNWVWNIFAPHYIELVKSRAYKQNEASHEEVQSVRYCLHQILQVILKLLAPITPFVTEGIYQYLYEPLGSIHHELLPKSKYNQSIEDPRTYELIKLDSFIWKAKRDRGLSLKASITSLYIPNTLTEFIPDLKEMHNIKTILTIKPNKNEEGIIHHNQFAIKF
ncbi:MAG: class I tRNA ligase family protein [Candidatus Heimdallarchaeota archaeon]|nr:MAG: class I tRNA ligase family protein [Candidatus Heimdallarchaeota archaeon]